MVQMGVQQGVQIGGGGPHFVPTREQPELFRRRGGCIVFFSVKYTKGVDFQLSALSRVFIFIA